MGPFFVRRDSLGSQANIPPNLGEPVIEPKSNKHDGETELAEGIRRQMAIEAEKARERQTLGETFPEGSGGRARDKAGAAFGISGRQAEKVLFVSDNADLLDPADFADWDEGKQSTNKAYQRIGEILRELPTRQGARTDRTSSDATDKVTRKQAIEASGIERSQAYDLQAMAANPDVVQAGVGSATVAHSCYSSNHCMQLRRNGGKVLLVVTTATNIQAARWRLVRILTNRLSAPTSSSPSWRGRAYAVWVTPSQESHPKCQAMKLSTKAS